VSPFIDIKFPLWYKIKTGELKRHDKESLKLEAFYFFEEK